MPMPDAFGPPPDTVFECTPGADEIARFLRDGFLAVPRLTTDEELAWIARILEFVFSPEQSGHRGAPQDRSGSGNTSTSPCLQQAFFPELRFPALLQTQLHRNARRYAAALLGEPADALSSWGHAIAKPPGGRDTPWHQDLAYWQPELDYHALGMWLPLHEVSTEMGAMQFIPGSHLRGLLPHRHTDAPEHNLLTVDAPFDPAHAVACPLPAGGATFHHCLTLHYTAPNSTSRARLAYPVEFQRTPVRRAVPRAMPWVDAFRAVAGTPDLLLVADGKVSRL